MNKKQKDNLVMDIKQKNLTQEEIDVIFDAVNRFRKIKNRELTEREIEKLINKVCGVAQY